MTFASLGPAPDGGVVYCTDCVQTNPCRGGGTGAVAHRIHGAWSCTGGAATLPGYTMATLPPSNPGSANRLALVTDDQRGIWYDTGTGWVPVNGRGIYKVSDFGNDIQSAIDAVRGCVDPGCFGDSGTVELGAGVYKLRKPLLVNKNSMTMRGRGKQNVTVIRPEGSWVGPTVMVAASNYPALPTQASLVPGPGAAMTYDGSPNYWINLRDSPTMDLDGLTALTIEFFYKPGQDTAGSFTGHDLSASGGRISSHSPLGNAYDIYQYANNSIRATLTINGTPVIITSPSNAISVGKVSHIALTYDNTAVRLFIDGALAASQAATGLITQLPCEDATLGAPTTDWPNQTHFNFMATGAIDSFRVSNKSRYTAAFAKPTAKFTTADSNTLMLLNFEAFWGCMVVGKTNIGLAYLPFHYNGAITTGALMGHIQIKDLDIYSNDGGCLYITSVVSGDYEHLFLAGGRIGLYAYDNDFLSNITDIKVNTSYPAKAIAGMLLSHAAGLFNISNVDITGGAYGFVLANGSAQLNRLAIAPNQYTHYSVVLRGFQINTSSVMVFPSVDDETSDVPGGRPVKGNLLLDNMNSFNVVGGIFEMGAAGITAPNIVIDGGANIHFDSMQWQNVSTSPNVKILSSPKDQIILTNTNRYNTAPPIADDLTKVQVISGGRGEFPNGILLRNGQTFASLGTPTPVNGEFRYCTDCTITNPCAAGGTGAFAKRLNNVWVCN